MVFTFDPFPFKQDGLAVPEVDIGGREVAQALVIAPVIIVFDEGGELGFEITGQIVALQQDAVLEGLVPALNFALGLGMARCAPDMLDALLIEPFGQIAGDYSWIRCPTAAAAYGRAWPDRSLMP